MKNLHLFTGYKKNSELCVPPSTASKHRPCGSFFALFLIFVLFLVSSCGGESPSPTPKAAGDTPPTTKPADPYVPNQYYDSVKFDFSKLDPSADITRITLAYTLTRGTYGTPFADTASSDFSTSDSSYILQGLTPKTKYYYLLIVTRGDATQDVSGDFTTIANVDDNNNGLIDIYNVAQLHNMRYNLEGTGYKTTSDTADGYAIGCPNNICSGYELKNNLTFDRAGSKSGTWSTSGTGYTLDPDDNAAPYFVVDPNDGTGGWLPIGSVTTSGACVNDCFDSVFEGNGYIITGLAISRNTQLIGMFGATGAKAQIRVGLVANLASYTGNPATIYIGGLVGVQVGGSITASYATGAVDAGTGNTSQVGGLVGETSGSITASYATGAVDTGTEGAANSVGGLVGNQDSGSITASYATGAVDVGTKNLNRVGGLVGNKESGFITASYATGAVNGRDGNDVVGGLVGNQNGGSITASYATGTVNGRAGSDQVGDLVGNQNSGSITASYGFGMVSGGSPNSLATPSPVDNATALTSANAGDDWDHPAWDFSTDLPPALQYADYDGTDAGATNFACGEAASTTNNIYIPYCGNFLPGQERTPVPAGTSATPAGASALLGNFALVDQDHDGYIDINNLGALRNIIHNPEGTSYKTSATSQGRTNGCPSNICQGYELTRNFHAAEFASGGGLDHLLRNILTQDAIIKSNGYSIADLYLED